MASVMARLRQRLGSGHDRSLMSGGRAMSMVSELRVRH